MGRKELGFDVVYRGQTREYIIPGTYVFFQRQKEHGGGYWLGQVNNDCFVFTIDVPISLRIGMEYLMSIKRNEPQLGIFDDSLDTFMLKSE